MASMFQKARSAILTASAIGIAITGSIYGAGLKYRQETKHETVSEELPPSRARIMHLERRKQALLMKRMALEEKIKGLQEKRAARNLADTTRSTQSKP